MRHKVEVGDVISGDYFDYDFRDGAEVIELRYDGTAGSIMHPRLGRWFVCGLHDYTVLSRKRDASDAADKDSFRLDSVWNFVHAAHIRERIIVNETKTMDKFKLFLTKEPFKTYRKAGITNGDNILTDDGVKIFLTYLLDKNPEFVDVAKELVDEKK